MKQLNKIERKELKDLKRKQERVCLTFTEDNRLKFLKLKEAKQAEELDDNT